MVVVTTGTLSLGINMPCKIVVPSGDCVYLAVPNFRQSSGRVQGAVVLTYSEMLSFKESVVDKVAGYLVLNYLISMAMSPSLQALFYDSSVSCIGLKLQTTRFKWSIPYYHIPGSILVTIAFDTRFCIVSDSRFSICAHRVWLVAGVNLRFFHLVSHISTLQRRVLLHSMRSFAMEYSTGCRRRCPVTRRILYIL